MTSKKDVFWASVVATLIILGIVGIVVAYFWTRSVQARDRKKLEAMPGNQIIIPRLK
jgi:hypothetical protein